MEFLIYVALPGLILAVGAWTWGRLIEGAAAINIEAR